MEDKALATRVILVRHGETSFNAEGRVQGHIDISTLTEKGAAEARLVGQALQGIPIQAFYHSPLQRARQTAENIADVLGQELAQKDPAIAQPTVSPNLIEISLPLWEGLLFDEVKVQYPDAYRDWHQAPHLLKMDDPKTGQPFFPVQALFAQARRLWDEVLPAHPNQTVLLVGHSGINRSLICTALNLPPDRYQTIQQANCNISILNFPDNTLGSAQLESLNITSHLGLPLPQVRKSHDAVRLLLVRHGETDWNRQGRFQGQIDIPLNENGHQQAKQAADFLQSVPLDFAITSAMKRPKETAQAILQHHPQVELAEEPDFREISHGTWEGKLEAEIEQEFPGDLERWRVTPELVQMPEGENLQQVWDRAIAAWDEMVQSARVQAKDSGRTSVGLVVAHDATNKVILSHVVGAGAEKFWSFKQGNGAVSVIDYPAEGPPILQAMNITTHLGGVLDRTAAGAL
ncbi:MAG: histidine phosphatase family protein [Thermosynechococcaceae cyanobacterium MS004]|nr:histidine phosphatase family protein [Thermosynechococcaceae cyanobacterium MS004]